MGGWGKTAGAFEATRSFSYNQLREIFRSVSRFEGEIDEILDSAIELSLDFGKCVMSSFEVIESGGSQGPPRSQEAKMPGVDTGNTLSKTLIKKKKNDRLVYWLVSICTFLLLAKDFLISADRVVII